MTRIVAGLFALLALVAAPVAHADDPLCDFTNSCSYDHPWNGPGLNTWDVPGTYGGWTTNRLQCDPISYRCYQVAP